MVSCIWMIYPCIIGLCLLFNFFCLTVFDGGLV